MISNSSYRASCKPLFVGHKLLTLPCLYILELLTNVRSCIGLFENYKTYIITILNIKLVLTTPFIKPQLWEEPSPYGS